MSKKKRKPTPKKKTTKKRYVVEEAVVEKTPVVYSNFDKVLPYVLLFIIPIALYFSTIDFEYVLDDKIVLTENSFVQKGFDGVGDIFSTESFTGYFGSQKDLVVGARYRPLSIATFAVEHAFFNDNEKISHGINLLLYALTGLLLFKVLALFFKPKKRWYFGIPFIASLLFLLHPLHTEVGANVKSRDEILALLLSLGTLYYCYKYVATRKWMYLLFAPIVFLIALFAKENALTFLAIIPISLYFFTKQKFKQIALILAPLLVSAVVFLFIRYQVIGYFLDSGKEVTGLMNNPFVDMSVSEKFATLFYTLGLYIKLLFFPHPLTHDYYPYQIPIMNWGDIKVIFSVVGHAIMAIYALFSLKMKLVIGWAIMFYLATLSIVSNLPFTIGTFMNERFMYMPSVGFVVFLSYVLLEKVPLWLKKIPKIAKPISIVLLLLFLGVYTYR